MTNTDAPAIRCADCAHCKVFKHASESGRYILRVRCARDHWRRGKDGTVIATYHYHTVLRRSVSACPDYVSLSANDDDRRAYLDDLACTLPVEKLVYDPDGSLAGLPEDD